MKIVDMKKKQWEFESEDIQINYMEDQR